MKVFLAGATGAIGRSLLPLLVKAGHQVTGTTRVAAKADAIRAAGAEPAVLDALNAGQVLEAVKRAQPEVIMHQLTAIPARINLRRYSEEFAMTDRLRTEGVDHLLTAARAVNCRRFIAQSFPGWFYEREGGWVKSEEDPLLANPEPAFRSTLAALVHLETAVLQQGGSVLRYGSFYYPGCQLAEEVRRRRVPVVGKGTGYWSFIHLDDAAAATLAAIDAPEPGLYNIADDEPAPVAEWLPFLACALRVKPPRHVPEWLGRLAVGPHGVAMMTSVRGSANRKAKRSLGWKPKWPTWRQGFLQLEPTACIPEKGRESPFRRA